MTQSQPKKSDLPVRAASAVVMVAVAGTALWLGGWWWTVFVAAVALGVLWEWVRLAFAFAEGPVSQAFWLLGGIVYLGIAILPILGIRDPATPEFVLGIVALVVAVDVGAYAFGRTVGGPKIAPSISPSKTWSGLFGGMLGAFLVAMFETYFINGSKTEWSDVAIAATMGILIAVIAQTGDFFESWMKRRAGVKDSGKLIPGHGGLFDRVDGLLAVLFVLGLFAAYQLLNPPPLVSHIVY